MKRVFFKRALITGGSSGIGLAAASVLAERGCSLVLVGRDRERLDSARKELQGRYGDTFPITLIPGDVSCREEITKILSSEVLREPIDLLILSAGMVIPGSFEDTSHEDFDRTISVNLTGTWNVLKAVVPYMGEGASIVIVSSLAGLLGTYGYSAYGASKFALAGLGEVLRNELSRKGIHVSVLCPPDTDTPQLTEERIRRPEETRALSGNARVLTPEEVAGELIRGVNRKKFLIIPGMQGKVIFLLKRLMPSMLFAVMDRTVFRIGKKRGLS